MVTNGLESIFVGDPAESDLYSFWGCIRSGSLVGVTKDDCVVRAGQLFLDLRFLSSCAIRVKETIITIK